MKNLLLVAFMFSLASCNTGIGIWRDTKAAYNWSKTKIQESQNGGGGGGVEYDTQSGAPVY
jgi:predicted small secreted protein